MEAQQIKLIWRKPAYFLTANVFARYVDFTVLTEKITVFWPVISCSAVQINLQGGRMKTVSAGCFKD